MPTCFVIMPISTPAELVAAYDDDHHHFEHVLAELHTPAAELVGYDVIPPAVVESAVIQAEIIRNLEQADLVVCDISTLNANVFFELGIRVALDRPVALIKDDLTKEVPFDNAIVSCHTYDSRLKPWALRAEIKRLAEWIGKAGGRERNAMWQYFGISRRAEAPDPSDPVQAKLDVLLAEIAVIRRRQRDLELSGKADESTTQSSVEFQEAVDRLLYRCGLNRRLNAFTLRLEPERRLVALDFGEPPLEYVREILREEASRLDIDLRVSSAKGPA